MDAEEDIEKACLTKINDFLDEFLIRVHHHPNRQHLNTLSDLDSYTLIQIFFSVEGKTMTSQEKKKYRKSKDIDNITRLILALKAKDRRSFNHLKPSLIVNKDPVQIMFLLEAFDLMHGHYKAKRGQLSSVTENDTDSKSTIATLIREVVPLDSSKASTDGLSENEKSTRSERSRASKSPKKTTDAVKPKQKHNKSSSVKSTSKSTLDQYSFSHPLDSNSFSSSSHPSTSNMSEASLKFSQDHFLNVYSEKKLKKKKTRGTQSKNLISGDKVDSKIPSMSQPLRPTYIDAAVGGSYDSPSESSYSSTSTPSKNYDPSVHPVSTEKEVFKLKCLLNQLDSTSTTCDSSKNGMFSSASSLNTKSNYTDDLSISSIRSEAPRGSTPGASDIALPPLIPPRNINLNSRLNGASPNYPKKQSHAYKENKQPQLKQNRKFASSKYIPGKNNKFPRPMEAEHVYKNPKAIYSTRQKAGSECSSDYTNSECSTPTDSCSSVDIANVVSLHNARNEEFKDYIIREMQNMDEELEQLKCGTRRKGQKPQCSIRRRQPSSFSYCKMSVSSRFPDFCSGVIIPRCRNCSISRYRPSQEWI